MIPEKIHQIWLGGLDARPKRIAGAMSRIEKAFVGWEYRIWTEADYADLGIERYAGIRPFAALSDLMRYRILAQHGGYYIDADCEPNGSPLRLPTNMKVFVLNAPHQKRCWNGLIGCEPGHPLLRSAYRHTATVFDGALAGEPIGKAVINLTGPGLLYRLANKSKTPLRRWNRWMTHVHPDVPLVHYNLHSWAGQSVRVEVDA